MGWEVQMVDAGAYIAGLLGGRADISDLMEMRDLLVDRLHEREDALWELRGDSLSGEPSAWDLYRDDLNRLAAVCIAMATLEPSFE